MNKYKAYELAIDILSNENIDYRALVIQIAKDNPQQLVKSNRIINPYVHPIFGKEDWYKEISKFLKRKEKIIAIKIHRERTGHDLKKY